MNKKANIYFCSNSENEKRIDLVISIFLNCSRTKANQYIKKNLIYKNGIIVNKPSMICFIDDKIEIFEEEQKIIIQENIELEKIEIIFENKDFFIINKPANIKVHKSCSNDFDYNLCNFIESKNLWNDSFFTNFNNRYGLIHRLDKETSGIIIIARNTNSQNKLSDLFAKRLIKKTYIALVTGKIEKSGVIDQNLIRSPLDPTKIKICFGQGRKAITKYEKIKEYNEYTSVYCYPETGRTHQIRVHMASINCPLLGDKKYGKTSDLIGRQALHALKLEFEYENQIYSFEVKIPDDINKLI